MDNWIPASITKGFSDNANLLSKFFPRIIMIGINQDKWMLQAQGLVTMSSF